MGEIRGSNWTLGCETLDRDFADFEQYKRFLAPLGIKTIRLQAGWAKCEKEKGKYDFAWLDNIIDYARSQGTKDTTFSTYEYKKADGRRVLVFWTHANETKSLKSKYMRPSDSFQTRPAVFKYPGGKPFKEPVWIDLFTGRVYAFPKENQIVVPAGVVFIDVPVYDSPCVLTDRSAVEL